MEVLGTAISLGLNLKVSTGFKFTFGYCLVLLRKSLRPEEVSSRESTQVVWLENNLGNKWF